MLKSLLILGIGAIYSNPKSEEKKEPVAQETSNKNEDINALRLWLKNQ